MILICTLYDDICTALLKASTGCIEKGRASNNEHMVPGWNDSVTDGIFNSNTARRDEQRYTEINH